MKWNELKRQALKHGFVLDKHGSKHDIYVNEKQALPCNLKDTEQQKQKRA